MDHKENIAKLSDLYQRIITDMKSSAPILEELTGRALKLQTSIKFAVANLSAFLDTLQRLADITTNSKGATREIGCALTRLCLRHRNLENKLKMLAAGISENFAYPIQDELEDWKKETIRMDKSHSKDLKKTNKELKQLSVNLSELQKKLNNGSVHQRSGDQSEWVLAGARQDLIEQGLMAESSEGASLRSAMLEERSRLCTIVACLLPVLDMEVSALNEGIHIQEVVESLGRCTENPQELPPSSEQVIEDLTSGNHLCVNNTRLSPLSPTMSHRSSHRSSLSSVSSHSSGPLPVLPPPAWSKPTLIQSPAPDIYPTNGEYSRTNSDETSNSSSGDSGCVCSASVKNEAEDEVLNSFMLEFTEQDHQLYKQSSDNRRELRNCFTTSDSTNLEEAIRQLELTTAALDQNQTANPPAKNYNSTTFPDSSSESEIKDLPLQTSINNNEVKEQTTPHFKFSSCTTAVPDDGSRYKEHKASDIQHVNGSASSAWPAEEIGMKVNGSTRNIDNTSHMRVSKSNQSVERQRLNHSTRKAVSSSHNDVANLDKSENANTKPNVKPKPMLTPNLTHRVLSKPAPPVRRSSSTSMKPLHSPITIDENSAYIENIRTKSVGCDSNYNNSPLQGLNPCPPSPRPPALHQTLSIPAVPINVPGGHKPPRCQKMSKFDRKCYSSDGEEKELNAERRAQVVAALNKHLAKPSRPAYVTKAGQMKSFSGPDEVEAGIFGQKYNGNEVNFQSEII